MEMTTIASGEQCWAETADGVETLTLRPGLILVMSRIAAGDGCAYHYVESSDVIAIGFHLLGGAAFDLEGASVATVPLDVHAAAAPAGSMSRFTLPERGFRTVALRFAPALAQDLFDRHGHPELAAMAGEARQGVAAARLAPLDPAGAATVEAMFAAPRDGARTLYLEAAR